MPIVNPNKDYYDKIANAQTITSASLTPVPKVPFQQPVPSPIPDIASLGADFSITPQEQQAEQQVRDVNTETRSLIQSLAGESTFREDQAQAQGIPELQKQQTELASRLKSIQNEALAIPLQLQQESIGRGRTSGGLQPIQTAALRNNAIQALSTASLLEASRGNLTLAQDFVDRAVSAKYDPIKAQIDANLANLDLIMKSPDFTNAQKKRAEERARAEEDRRVAIQYAVEEERFNRNGVIDTMNTAAQFGASQDVLSAISGATTYQEAITAAGQYLQDPLAKQQLINAQTQAIIQQQSIRRENYEFSLLQKYGGMTPTEYSNYVKSQNAQIAAAKSEQERKQAQAQVLGEKVDLTSAILNSKALDSVVGTVPGINRLPSSTIGRLAGLFTPATFGATFGGIKDITTGEQQSLIASTEQLVSKEFLDNLINVKAQGATFGALTEKEQIALTEAATLIGGRRVYKGSGDARQVAGYNMSQASFKAEIKRIQDLARTAYERAQGEAWDDGEQDIWNQIQQAQEAINFNPTF